MQYEETGNVKASKGAAKRTATKIIEQMSTWSILWILVKRHKVGLLALGNVVLVLNWAFPAWTEFVKSII